MNLLDLTEHYFYDKIKNQQDQQLRQIEMLMNRTNDKIKMEKFEDDTSTTHVPVDFLNFMMQSKHKISINYQEETLNRAFMRDHITSFDGNLIPQDTFEFLLQCKNNPIIALYKNQKNYKNKIGTFTNINFGNYYSKRHEFPIKKFNDNVMNFFTNLPHAASRHLHSLFNMVRQLNLISIKNFKHITNTIATICLDRNDFDFGIFYSSMLEDTVFLFHNYQETFNFIAIYLFFENDQERGEFRFVLHGLNRTKARKQLFGFPKDFSIPQPLRTPGLNGAIFLKEIPQIIKCDRASSAEIIDGFDETAEVINQPKIKEANIIGYNTLHHVYKLKKTLTKQVKGSPHLNDHEKRKLQQKIKICRNYDKKQIRRLQEESDRGCKRDRKESKHVSNHKYDIPSNGELGNNNWEYDYISFQDLLDMIQEIEIPLVRDIMDDARFFKIALSFYSFYHDPSISNLIIWISLYALEFDITPYKLYQELKKIFPYISTSAQNIVQKYFGKGGTGMPRPQERNEDSVASALDVDDLSTIASVIAGVAAIIGSVVIGVKNFTEDIKGSWITRISKTGAHITKIKNGIYSVINIVKDFSDWVKDFVKTCLIKEPIAVLQHLLTTQPCKPKQKHLAENFFKNVAYYTDPSNDIEIRQGGQQKLNEVNDLISIANHTLYLNSTKEVIITEQQSRLIRKAIDDLSKVRMRLARNPDVGFFRKTPFWIYLAGTPGTGKSQIMPKVLDALLSLLRKDDRECYDNSNHYDLLADDMKAYSLNFSDKFWTGYIGQWAVMVDDIFQDSAPLGETSSALFAINGISCIPHHVNKASLDEKGELFTSNLMISSSNVVTPSNRSEIIDQTALQRRRGIVIVMKGSAANGYDLFDVVDKFDATKIYYSNINFMKLMPIIMLEYKKHWNEQLALENKEVSQPDIEEMYKTVQQNQASNGYVDNTMFGHFIAPFSWRKIKYCFYFWILSFFTGLNWYCTNFLCNILLGEWNIEWVLYFNWLKGSEMIQTFKTPWTYLYNSMLRSFSLVKSKMQQLMISGYYKYVIGLGTIVSFIALYAGYRMYSPSVNSTPSAIQYNNSPNLPAKQVIVPSGIQYNNSPAQPPQPVIVPSNGIDNEVSENIFANPTTPADLVTPDIDRMAQQLVHNNLINKNGVCLIKFIKDNKNNDTSAIAMNAIRIKGTFILTCHHFFLQLERFEVKEFEIQLKTNNGIKIVKQQYNPDHMTRLGLKDAAVYKCDTSMPSAPDLTNHFPKTLPKKIGFQSVLVTRFPSSSIIANLDARPLTTPAYWSTEGSKSVTPEYSTVNYFRVENFMQIGASGSPLIAIDNKITTKILGIQCSVNLDKKYSNIEPIFRSELTAITDTEEQIPLDLEQVVEVTHASNGAGNPDLGLNSLMYLGRTPHHISTSMKTKLRPSLIYSLTKPEKFPSVLTSWDKRVKIELPKYNLAFYRARDFDQQYGSIDTSELLQARKQISLEYSAFEGELGRRILTNEEMVNGAGKHLKPFDKYTSPGYPWIMNRKEPHKGGKWEWFEQVTENEFKIKDELMQRINKHEQMMLNGKRPPYVAYYCLKDELRKIEKIEAAKTRGFVCLDQDFNLLTRKYCHAFIETVRSMVGTLGPCVGLDPQCGWTNLYYTLLSKSKENWQDFDYAGWDSSVHPELITQAFELINDWYGEDEDPRNKTLRRVIASIYAYTPIIINNEVYCMTGGVPSGGALTADLNSLIHEILIYYVWRKYWMPKHKSMVPLSKFRDNVARAIYGDDLILVNTDLVKEFNGNNIAHFFNELGMNITSAQKNLIFDFKKPEQVTFLKRFFKKDDKYPKIIRCPLEQSSIEPMLSWIHNCDDVERATKDNLDTVFREADQWGSEYYNYLVKLLTTPQIQKCFRVKYTPPSGGLYLDEEIFTQ